MICMRGLLCHISLFQFLMDSLHCLCFAMTDWMDQGQCRIARAILRYERKDGSICTHCKLRAGLLRT